MKKNKTEKYSLLLEGLKEPVGTAWNDNSYLYVDLKPEYRKAFLTLMANIKAKGNFNSIEYSMKEKYLEIKNANIMFVKAVKQESGLYLKIHFIEETL